MRAQENGSVLIEAMVATAMIALMLGVMYQSLIESAAHQNAVSQKRMALLVAQSELDAVGSALPLAPGSAAGTEGPYAWRVDIVPFPIAQGTSTAGRLLQVTVSAGARQGNSGVVTLRTLELAPAS